MLGCTEVSQKPTELADTSFSVSDQVAIKALVDDYAVYRDSLDGDGYANLFAPNGKFHFRGNVFQGYEALKKRIDDTDPTFTTMHQMATGQISINEDGTASGIHYATIYSHASDIPRQEGESRNLESFAVMGRYIDEYVLTDQGWKFADRRFQPSIVPEE